MNRTTPPSTLTLYPYQQEDLDAWLAAPTPRALWNTNEMSLGKTVDGVVCSKAADYNRILVVCTSNPKSMRLEWRAEFAKWWPEREEAAVIDKGFMRKTISMPERFRMQAALENRTHIVSVDLLHKLVALHNTGELPAYDCIIVDEFHNIQSWWSKAMQALWELRTRYPQCDLKLLSGTPIGADPLRAWTWLKLSEPHKWGQCTLKENVPFLFRKTYGEQHQSDHSYSGFTYKGVNKAMLPKFRERTAHLIRRKTAAEVGLQLPPMRFALKTYEVTETPHETAAEWALSAAPHAPVGVFTEHVARMDDIEAEIIRGADPTEYAVVRLHQEHSGEERKGLVVDAMNSGKHVVILATTGLISTGVNYLADIRNWMLAEPTENPATLLQLARRFTRLSSKDKSPRVGYLLYRDGEEFAAQKALAGRAETTDGLIKPTEDSQELRRMLKGNSNSSFLATLALLGRNLAAHGADDEEDDDYSGDGT